MKFLQENDVWDQVELPPGRKVVGSKYETDYDETFCPVVRQESLRVLIALSVQSGLKLHQVDVTTVFLNGTLEEEVFMKQPEGFEIDGKEHLVCKLKKSIYGLKQSPCCRHWKLNVSVCEHTTRYRICCEQSGQIYVKAYDGALDSPETSATLLERNPEARYSLH